MRGWVFENLPALQQVYLELNECISRNFEGDAAIRELSKTVNETCGTDKTETQIACERLTENFQGYTCDMRFYTLINDIGFTISYLFNDNILKIDLSDNRNIEFLPISPHQTFPNLKDDYARRCAIREISKANFEKMHYLERIVLHDNQIYAVLSDTFEGLTSLWLLDLSKLKIKCLAC